MSDSAAVTAIVCQKPQDTMTTREPANSACGTRVSRRRGCPSPRPSLP